jgi:hypothetical protein
VSELDALLAALETRGALAFRRLPQEERRWRGRYLLMVASLGSSASLAWGAALAANDGDRALADEVDEALLLETLRRQQIDIEALLPYD